MGRPLIRTRIPRARAHHRGEESSVNRALWLGGAALAALLIALASPPGHAAEAPHTTSIGGLSLPEYIGPLEFIGEHSGPEGAASMSYMYRAVGLALEINVTDLGAGGVADGIEAPELIERYRETKL